MDLHQITPDFTVAGQIEPSDMAALAAAGFTTVISNRPDAEVPPSLQTQDMRRAAEEAGLIFVANPVINGAMTMDMVTTQAGAIEAASGPVIAYCRSGMRAAVVWALSQAGNQPTANLIEAAARAGFDIRSCGGQIEALAARP